VDLEVYKVLPHVSLQQVTVDTCPNCYSFDQSYTCMYTETTHIQYYYVDYSVIKNNTKVVSLLVKIV